MAGNEVYYDSNKKMNIQRTMENVQNEYKGTTRDGYKIYHWSYFDRGRGKHISYDTVLYNGEHQYIYGSGHEQDDRTRSISRWDSGNRQSWIEAQSRNAEDIIQKYY